MNLYVRYFDYETLATNMNEVAEFISSIKEINVDENSLARVKNFWESDNAYPFRLKVSFSNYVLFLKTDAHDLPEFKYLEQLRKENKGDGVAPQTMSEKKRSLLDALNEPKEGWYEATLMFKRVVQIRTTNKFQYRDTRFKVRLKAASPMDCYNRVVEHLRNRQDVDPRSQFPSAKSANFVYTFLDDDNAVNEEDKVSENPE
jgi:hypothetical protein